MSLFQRIESVFLGQRGFLFPWTPVFLAIGIGLYFSLKQEPALLDLWALSILVLIFSAVSIWLGAGFAPLIWAVTLVLLGVLLAAQRAQKMAGPMLSFRYYGAVEGRIVDVDLSSSGALRLTLDQVVLERMEPSETPEKVRISMHGQQGYFRPDPGRRIIATAHLSAPRGPVEPGGYDFRRHAWFMGLGAIGYTRTPVLSHADSGRDLWLSRLRHNLSRRIQEGLAGTNGALAAAILTGDRSGIGEDTLTHLRRANLAHLLAISGLHMGLLTGFVFTTLRLILVLLPVLGLRIPARKVAAFFALVAGAGYLALSGGNVATERAFIMVAVMLVAVMINRRAISMRAVALAALIVLTLRPESLLSPGFQMSFSATTALVACFSAIRERGLRFGSPWLRFALSLLISSTVAGLATAPFAAAHFNMVSKFGLIANLLSVPFMGILVIPAGVIAVFLMPFGLEWVGLELMGYGLGWIAGVAEWFGTRDGAVGYVVAPPGDVLPLLALGALFVFLWQGRARVLGIVPIAAALISWGEQKRPDVLIADTGAIVGVMTDAGRALSRDRGSGFIARTWLENDGEEADQERAAARWNGPVSGQIELDQKTGKRLIHASGKRAFLKLSGCQEGDILVTDQSVDASWPCEVFDLDRLKRTGSIAIYLPEGEQLQIQTSRETVGDRLWHHTAWEQQ